MKSSSAKKKTQIEANHEADKQGIQNINEMF